MGIKKIVVTAILGFSLFSFGMTSQASELTHQHEDVEILHNHDKEEVAHNHAEGTEHNHGEELQASDIGVMYIPCPITGGNHQMYYQSAQISNGGNTGASHYHSGAYCQAYIQITKSLYSCVNCGFDEWRESSKIIHPGY